MFFVTGAFFFLTKNTLCTFLSIEAESTLSRSIDKIYPYQAIFLLPIITIYYRIYLVLKISTITKYPDCSGASQLVLTYTCFRQVYRLSRLHMVFAHTM